MRNDPHQISLQLLEALDSFFVVERDGSIIACAALFTYFEERCGELAAIAVSPECRGHGQGDKLIGIYRIFSYAYVYNFCFKDLILSTFEILDKYSRISDVIKQFNIFTYSNF